MPFAKIPLSFATMELAYRDNKTLPPDIAQWIKDQNKREQDFNDNLDTLNQQRAAEGKSPLKKMGHSTTCCMQASLSFNATNQPIPKMGSRDRDNTTLTGGRNYILTVDEFRAYLTYRYGPTDTFAHWSDIQGMTGVVIFGSGHIELFDGDTILQSLKGLGAHGRNSGAVMSDGFLNSSTPWYFWETTGDKAATTSLIPDWLVGWWTIYDGNYYYYYFFGDGAVVYIEQKPNAKWTPPKTVGNRGNVVPNPNVHGFKVTWTPTKGETTSTIEDFTPLGWSSQTEMNAVSNKYSPIYARKIS